jgi:anti-anti-sigma regulatory factor
MSAHNRAGAPAEGTIMTTDLVSNPIHGEVTGQPPPPTTPARSTGRAPARVSVVANGRRQVTLTVRGWLDRVGVARLRTTLAEVRATGTPGLRLDVSGLSGWDSGLPRALAWAHIQLRGEGQELILTGASERLHTEIDQAHRTLGLPLLCTPCPGHSAYRPGTEDQP